MLSSKSPGVIVLLLFILPPVRAASVFFETSAKAFDKAVAVQSDGGAGPFAQVDHTVNTSFPLRNIGNTKGTATAIAGPRMVGLKLEGEAQLNTQLNTGFGVELKAKAQVIDVFILDARLPDGSVVPSGFFGFSALARGQVDFYGTTTLNDFSSAELRYTLNVGQLGGGSDDILRMPTSASSPRIVATPLAGVIPWFQGQPVQILMLADASLDAKLEASGNFDGIVEFGNSLEWQGITDVTDDAGNPVASFTAMSPDTGVDWGQPKASPLITIERKNESLVLSWPESIGDVVLETSPVLGAGAIWTDVDATPELVEGQQVVTISIGTGAHFFRLRNP
jgi:hypothetical protein